LAIGTQIPEARLIIAWVTEATLAAPPVRATDLVRARVRTLLEAVIARLARLIAVAHAVTTDRRRGRIRRVKHSNDVCASILSRIGEPIRSNRVANVRGTTRYDAKQEKADEETVPTHDAGWRPAEEWIIE